MLANRSWTRNISASKHFLLLALIFVFVVTHHYYRDFHSSRRDTENEVKDGRTQTSVQSSTADSITVLPQCLSSNLVERLSIPNCAELSETGRDDEVYMFLITNDLYMEHTMALEMSLRNVRSSRRRVALVIPTLDSRALDILQNVLQLTVIQIPLLNFTELVASKEAGGRWQQALYKLAYHQQTQFRKVVTLDVDQVVLQNMDDLFSDVAYPELFYGAHDYWFCSTTNYENKMNAAVQIVRPSTEHYDVMMDRLRDPDRQYVQPAQHMPYEYWTEVQGTFHYLDWKYMLYETTCDCTALEWKTNDWYRPDQRLIHFAGEKNLRWQVFDEGWHSYKYLVNSCQAESYKYLRTMFMAARQLLNDQQRAYVYEINLRQQSAELQHQTNLKESIGT